MDKTGDTIISIARISCTHDSDFVFKLTHRETHYCAHILKYTISL